MLPRKAKGAALLAVCRWQPRPAACRLAGRGIRIMAPTGVRCPMARSYHVFGDIAGKLAVLRVEWTRCSRKGQYKVAKLVAQYGRDANMSEWMSELKSD